MTSSTTLPAFNALPHITAENYDQTKVSVLLKGDSGSGKTSTLLSFPEPIYIVYADVNLDTLRSSIASGRKVRAVPLGTQVTWDDYKEVIVSEIRNRKVEAATIGVDTIDFLSKTLVRKLSSTKDRMSQPDFGTFATRMFETTRDLVETTMPTATHPGYNIVFTSHLKPDEDEMNLVKYKCAITGKEFTDVVEDFFDYVLLCTNEMTSEIVGNVVRKKRQFKIYSFPPDKYHTCKGGKLPPEIVVPEGASAFEILNQYWKVKE